MQVWGGVQVWGGGAGVGEVFLPFFRVALVYLSKSSFLVRVLVRLCRPLSLSPLDHHPPCNTLLCRPSLLASQTKAADAAAEPDASIEAPRLPIVQRMPTVTSSSRGRRRTSQVMLPVDEAAAAATNEVDGGLFGEQRALVSFNSEFRRTTHSERLPAMRQRASLDIQVRLI